MSGSYDGTCPACGGRVRFPLRFCAGCRDSGADTAWHRAHPQPQPEHAPGHPIGAQAGPPGMWVRFCTIPGCDWRATS